MTHDQLADNLAAHLRSADRMVWCDMQLGPAGSPRPDVYTLFKSYVRPCPTAYEVKVSASDFRSDITAGKWQSYLKYASAVYFACEDGLIKPADLPEHCGLIVLKTAWRIRKKAVFSPVRIPEDALLKLLIDGINRESIYRRTDRGLAEYQRVQTAENKFGAIVGRTIRDRLAVEAEIEAAKYRAEHIQAEARQRADNLLKDAAKVDPLRAELALTLDLPADAPFWRIQGAIRGLRETQRENPAVGKLRQLMQSLENLLARYREEPEFALTAEERD